MKKVDFSAITWSYVRPEFTGNYPTEIFFENENISRGRLIEINGNEGILWDFDVWDSDGSREFLFKVYWFSGPLSLEKAKRNQLYGIRDFLKFIGWELTEE